MVSLLFVFFAVFEYVAVLLHSGMKEQKRKNLKQLRKHDAQIAADEIPENDVSDTSSFSFNTVWKSLNYK